MDRVLLKNMVKMQYKFLTMPVSHSHSDSCCTSESWSIIEKKNVFLAFSFVFHWSSPSVLDRLSSFAHYDHSDGYVESLALVNKDKKAACSETSPPLPQQQSISVWPHVPSSLGPLRQNYISCPVSSLSAPFLMKRHIAVWGQDTLI